MENQLTGGVLVVDKEAGVTSHDVVARVRRLYGTKQVGHTGTLDPMATGVLPILVGRAVKGSEYLLSEDKSYEAVLRLGITTDTQDTTGRILSVSSSLPDEKTVREVSSRFIGELAQTPPMYSALKKNGKKLVDLARAGIEVEREQRRIVVRDLAIAPIEGDPASYRLRVTCSKGTYIRTLCDDIGKALGCGGAMASLRRTRSGPFRIENARTIPELESANEAERASYLLPLESLFSGLPALTLPPFFRKLCSSGCPVYLHKIGAEFDEGTLLRLYGDGRFFALGRVLDYEEGRAVKAVKQFYLFERE